MVPIPLEAHANFIRVTVAAETSSAKSGLWEMFEIKLIFYTIKLSERIMVIVYNCKERGFDWSKAYHLVIKVASKPNTCNLLTTCSSSHACSNAQDFRTCRIDQKLTIWSSQLFIAM
jgi:predicted TIM-barrel enzyme